MSNIRKKLGITTAWYQQEDLPSPPLYVLEESDNSQKSLDIVSNTSQADGNTPPEENDSCDEDIDANSIGEKPIEEDQDHSIQDCTQTEGFTPSDQFINGSVTVEKIINEEYSEEHTTQMDTVSEPTEKFMCCDQDGNDKTGENNFEERFKDVAVQCPIRADASVQTIDVIVTSLPIVNSMLTRVDAHCQTEHSQTIDD